MDKQLMIRRTLLAMALASMGATGTVLAVDEQEANNPIQAAQQVTVGGGGSVTIQGAITHPGVNIPDVDFYSFEAKKGDTITVNIDGTGTDRLDASLFLFDPSNNRRAFNLDATRDSGSETEADPRIERFTLDTDGRWIVGVTSDPVILLTGGTMSRISTMNSGPYTLIISGVTAALQHIVIDIKPGSLEIAPINPKAKGVIPVALLSSPEFTPMDVAVNSLTFGHSGDEPSMRHCGKDGKDLNADGIPDLVCHFENAVAKFVRGDSMGVVRGKTKGGKLFEGSGDLKVVPEKRGE
jgi:hypothetical protein